MIRDLNNQVSKSYMHLEQLLVDDLAAMGDTETASTDSKLRETGGLQRTPLQKTMVRDTAEHLSKVTLGKSIISRNAHTKVSWVANILGVLVIVYISSAGLGCHNKIDTNMQWLNTVKMQPL